MFDVFLGPQPEKFLKKAEMGLKQRIWRKLDELKLNPFPSEVVRVVGKKEKIFRVRVGDYRIQYSVFYDQNNIFISDIDKRERAYI